MFDSHTAFVTYASANNCNITLQCFTTSMIDSWELGSTSCKWKQTRSYFTAFTMNIKDKIDITSRQTRSYFTAFTMNIKDKIDIPDVT